MLLVTKGIAFFQAKFPSRFPVLKSLHVDCGAAHGDDGSPIEKLLHGLPNLRVLKINAPICDLESCRIQGLTWSYKFPQLTHFDLSIFYQSAQDIASFLANHPSIRSLMLSAEGEEPIPNFTFLLPNLKALSMDAWVVQDHFTENPNPLRKITYLSVGSLECNASRLIRQCAPSLRCLEVELFNEKIWEEPKETDGFALVPDLSELALHFSSDGMDEEILSNILKALPKSSNLQVLRMKGNGSPLAIESFASLREKMPSSLKVLQWEIDNSKVRYEFEPGQSVRIVDPPEQQWPNTLLWSDASILNHLGS